MNDTPPSRARAIASRSSETDCMIAEVRGMFISSGGRSPRRKRQSGVRRDTLAGMQSADE